MSVQKTTQFTAELSIYSLEYGKRSSGVTRITRKGRRRLLIGRKRGKLVITRAKFLGLIIPGPGRVLP